MGQVAHLPFSASEARGAGDVRTPVRALVVTLLLRFATSLFALRFGQQVAPNQFLAAKNGLSQHLMGPGDGWRYLLYGIWQRFDTLWYLKIAAHGYDRPETTVFYPLYPFLIRCFTALTTEPTVAALVVSTTASFFLFWGIQELARFEWPGTELRALLLFALWPDAFIFMAAYADSLLIALVIWSIYSARRDRWLLAGALGCAAGLTKASGVLVVVPLGVILWKARKWEKFPALLLTSAGTLGFMLWVKLAGFPPSPAVYSQYWETKVSFPWQTLLAALPPVFLDGDWIIGMNLAALLVCAVILLLARNMPLEYVLFSAACLILFLTKHTTPILQSTLRYVLLVFPVFLYWARWIKRRNSALIILLFLCTMYFGMLRTFLWWGLIA